LKLEDALRVVRQRGLFMQEAVPAGEGAMAALIGGEIEQVYALCRESSELGVCSPANINSPGQVVIAGHRSAVEKAVRGAKEKGIRRAVLLAVSAPFHCELMRPAAERLAPVLDETQFFDLNVPLVTNVDAALITKGDQARQSLIRQVASPVLWSEAVRVLLEQGVTRFVEIGPGRVLSGLIKQISDRPAVVNVDSPETLEQAALACGL
jgi:[acyl-carrier-protein] S-malonyltransferase